MLSPEMLMQLQALGSLEGTPGLGMMPQMANYAAMPGGPMVAGPPAPQGGAPAAPPSQPFPINAATMAALGAASMGMRAGQRPPAPNAGLGAIPARAPGGFQPTYNRLPGGGGR
jgi:hypothetical protein